MATRPTPEKPLTAPPAHFAAHLSPVPVAVAFQHTNVDPFPPRSQTKLNHHPSGLDVPNHRPTDPQDILRWTSSFMSASSSRGFLLKYLGKKLLPLLLMESTNTRRKPLEQESRRPVPQCLSAIPQHPKARTP